MTHLQSIHLLAFLCVFALSGTPVWAQVRISEFMASNSHTVADENGDFEDWIELQNNSPVAVNLYNWSLTDNPGNLTKWKFPATNLPPGGILIVFASNQDRYTPGAPLHTNFKLDADGEFLALVDSTGTNIVTQFAPTYPPQVTDVSFGMALTASNITLVATGATARILVPSAANGGSILNYTWTGDPTNEPFNHVAWTSGATGVGFGTSDIGLNLQSAMLNSNASAFVRLPFVVSNPTNFSLLTLRLKYDDGFVAWINGIELARGNAPYEDLNWNSSASGNHAAAAFEEMTFGVVAGWLRTGTNILALQGLNIAATNSSFLILPELIGTTVAGEGASGVYFTSPTPGAENFGGAVVPGPGIANVRHTPNVPLDNDNLLVTAKVFATANPVTNVVLHYRVMFEPEVALNMFDDGTHGDGGPGDGIYGNSIPASASTNGQMVRYYITAQDTSNTMSRLPVFTDPASTAEYFGTVVNPSYVTSALPVVHLFAPGTVLQPGPMTTQTGADSDAGGRVSLFFDGELYDNVFMFLRGNTTAGYNKKSHRIRFNTEHKFRSNEPGERLKNTSFVADYADPTYMRQGLSFWLSDQIGASGPFYVPYRLQLNGAFYQLANHNDVHGEELLERLGFDPNGALYNAMGTIEPPRTFLPDGTWTNVFSNGGWEKKTRKWDTNGLDYLDLTAAISTNLSVGQWRTNIFDRLDLPEVISYMVAARIANESDDVRANLSIYYDNDGDALWRIIPFDMNLSWGANFLLNASYSGIQVTNDHLRSHPFYGASQAIPPEYGPPNNHWNRLYDAIISVPQTREMFLRRMRTVLDEYVKPVGAVAEQSPIYQKAIEWRNLIAAEAANDRAWWGWPPKNGQGNFDPGIDLTNGVTMLLNDFLAARRQHLYGKHSVINTTLPIGITRTNNAGIPLRQTNAVIAIVSWDDNPVSGNQDEEYVQLANSNSFAVDISGWKLDGGIHFQFRPGTVVPAHSALYVSPNTRAFRARATGPRGGQGLFAVGPYDGRLNSWGETLLLTDEKNLLVASSSFVGAPSLAKQFLRVTEIMYNPSPAPAITNDAQQFEYVELKNISTNITFNLTGVRFTNGIYFNFTGSAVTSLNPQQSVLLVRNQAAFTARHGGGFNIAGAFTGALDNGGETLRLEDSVGEKILEFEYNDAWYPITDGLGFSLVIVNETAPWNTWDERSSWRGSGTLNGSPGVVDPVAPTYSPIVVNEVLTHTDLPELDSVELFNPTTNAVNLGGWFLTDDFYTPKKYRIPNGTMILSNAFRVFDESAFNTGTGAFRFSESGESVYLFSGDANTNLTGYYHGFDFGEAPNDVSFGRYPNSQGTIYFTLQSTSTFGAENAYPRVGPIVISEIMYHPPDANGVDNELDEFIELQNISGSSVTLYDPGATTNTWRLRNAVDFDFPTNQLLAAGARLLVVGFDPTNPTQLAAFKSKYNVPGSVAVYGPWSGKLNNSGETIELKQPDGPDVTPTNIFIPFIMIDKVSYADETPWPDGAAGIGNSLQRVSNTGFGNDPTNWFAAGVTAGRATVTDQPPFVSITAPTNMSTIMTSNGVTVSVVAGDNDGSIALVQLLMDETEVARWSVAASNYFWLHPPGGTHELKARATDNLGAVAESQIVTVKFVPSPPGVTVLSPTNGTIVLKDTTVNLSATSSGIGQLSSVDFLLDGAWIGTVGSPLTLAWNATPAGPHTLSAIGHDMEWQTGLAASVTIFVQDISTTNLVLVSSNSSNWSYLDNGSNQGATWTALNFNDTSWSKGAAQFGYGDGDEATVISFGPNSNSKYITYYFRKSFVLNSLAGITNATLSVMRDDGAIAYVNGVEVFRSNMPTGAVNHLTLASSAVNVPLESVFYATNFSPSVFVVGTNILAVEVHQAQAGSSDLSFDAQLTVPGTFFGPAFLVQPTNQSVTVGSSPTFSVATTGSAPISMRWYFENAPLAAVSNALTLTNVQFTNAGQYYVVASNIVGVATSSIVSLAVIPNNPTAPKFESVRQNGTNFEFSFSAAANHTYTIQFRHSLDNGIWQSWADIPATTSNRTVSLTNLISTATNCFFRLITPAEP